MKNKKFFLVALIFSPALLLLSKYFRHDVFGTTIFDNKGKMHVFRGRMACVLNFNHFNPKLNCSGFGYTPIAGNKLEIIFYENETCRTYSTNLHRWKTPINQSPICKASYKIFSYEKMSYDLQNYDERITTYVLGNCKKSWTSKLPKYSRDILSCSTKLDWLGIVSNN